MKSPAAFPLDAAQSGVYAAPGETAELMARARAADLVWFEFDLARVDTKPELLARCEKVFGLPSTFGHNWDALADSLEDFSWRPARGYVVHLKNGAGLASHAPQELALALEIFARAATYWSGKRKLFLVLADAGTRGAQALKPLPR
jgi:RNAse (barnase) inhibitor barstar